MRVFSYLGAVLRDATGDAGATRAGLFADVALFGLVFSVVGALARNLTFALVFGCLAAACIIGWWLCSERRKGIDEAHRARASRRPKVVERALDRDS